MIKNSLFRKSAFHVDCLTMRPCLVILLLFSVICCDMSIPPVMEDHRTSISRTVEEEITVTEEQSFRLSLFIHAESNGPWRMLKFGSEITLPYIFSPIRFTESIADLTGSGYWDVPSLISDFFLIEQNSAKLFITSESKCTVTVISDHYTSIQYSLNGSGYRKYSGSVETSIPVKVTVRAESEYQTPVRYLSAGVSYSVSP